MSEYMCRYSIFSVGTRSFTGQICTILHPNRNACWLKRSKSAYVDKNKRDSYLLTTSFPFFLLGLVFVQYVIHVKTGIGHHQ